MKKFETLEDLAKAVGQWAGDLKKSIEYHKAAHAANMGEHAHHESQAAFHKAAHDAMDDGHEMKAHVGKTHEDHVHKAAFHKAAAEQHMAECDTAKATLAAAFGDEPELQKTTPAAPSTPSGVVDGLVAGMAGDLNTLAKDMIANDPAVKDMVRKTIADAIASALGNKIVPDGARIASATSAGDTPQEVLTHLKLVPRGSAGSGLQKAEVSADMEDAFAI